MTLEYASFFAPEHFLGILHNVHMPYLCVPERAGAHVYAPPHDICTFWMT